MAQSVEDQTGSKSKVTGTVTLNDRDSVAENVVLHYLRKMIRQKKKKKKVVISTQI